jgi:hypothetical protein
MAFLVRLLGQTSSLVEARSFTRQCSGSVAKPLLAVALRRRRSHPSIGSALLMVGAVAVVPALPACSASQSGYSSDEANQQQERDDNASSDSGAKGAGKDSGKDAGKSTANRDDSDDSDDDDGPAPRVKADGGSDVIGCGSVRAAAELERGPVDIIIALDTSLSMAPQVCNVSTNLTAFAAAVGASSHVVSVYEMGLLGAATALLCGNPDPLAATPLASDATRYLHRAVNVDSWNALTQLNTQFDTYRSFLRPAAATHFIVVSDDQSDPLRGGTLAADFKAQMEQKLGHDFSFHSIVADGQAGCIGSAVGTEYLTLSDQTGGQKLSICATDWSVVFKKLEAAVISSAPIPCDFEVPEPPKGDELDPEAVQVVFAPQGGKEREFPRAASGDKCGNGTAWHYDDPKAATKIELCPAACEAVKQGGNVEIAFGCAPTFVQ